MTKRRIVISIICIAMIAGLLAGCSAKTPITSDIFSQTMTSASFKVEDVTDRTQTNGLATSVIVAAKEDGSYQIEFWELTDSEVGLGIFSNNKNILSEEHSVRMMSSEINSGNYNYFAFTADGNFHMIARINNTMLYCEANKDYKGEIINFAKQLGYK